MTADDRTTTTDGGTTANDLAELKQYVKVHARSQRMEPAHYQAVLDRISNDDEGAAGSWADEWTRVGAELERDGKLLDASRHYNMARFPFVNGPARQDALDRCVTVFDRWRQDIPGIEPFELDLPGGRVRCWTSGLSGAGAQRLPVLLVMGGIVTVKEQWAPVLAGGKRLGMAGVVAELPGVGENGLVYGPDSRLMLSQLLDALAERADVSHTYALAMSFSGHLALRCAVEDPRIKGVVTVGAPINAFFTDVEAQRNLPRITLDTLAHLTGAKPANLADELREWVLSDEELAGLDIPVAYAASLRDEIIPQAEIGHLQRNVRRLDLIANDDVHGSPRHVREVGLWTLLSVQRMRGVGGIPRAVLESYLFALRARRRLLGSPQ